MKTEMVSYCFYLCVAKFMLSFMKGVTFMEIVFDYLSARYFRADIHELAIKERELNLRLAYDWLNNK